MCRVTAQCICVLNGTIACNKFANEVLCESISIHLNGALGTICKSTDI